MGGRDRDMPLEIPDEVEPTNVPNKNKLRSNKNVG